MAEELNRIDYSFIASQEGTAKVAYVPYCTLKSTLNKNSWCLDKEVGTPIQRSGVTIGTGLDLGQMNEYDLKRLKLSKGLQDKLTPYLGLKKKNAQDALNKSKASGIGLVLTDTEISELNKGVKQQKLRRICERYGQDSGKSFLSLTEEAQTAISSYLFQNGENINNDVWKAFVKQDWKKASELMKAEKNYKNRRSLEAGLLDEIASPSDKT